MRVRNGWLRVVVAATVTAMVVLPVAIASGSGAGATASGAKANATAKQLNALTKRLRGLKGKIAALEKSGATVQLPIALPPNGPAGGDLAGSYPRPAVAPNAVDAAEIVANAVGGSEIADNGVGAGELGADTVGTDAIKGDAITGSEVANENLTGDDVQNGTIGFADLHGVEPINSSSTIPGDSQQRSVIARCEPNTIAIGGGFEWSSAAGDVRITRSMPVGNTWEIAGLKTSGATTGLFAAAICLKP